ncbi:SWI/SNF complex subunit SWI3C [Camellia lanceoleosa]|uniref:SWI/SNF complex subunit SWI3C n=1 Tax=Camellia lanceoleosa TaxID=1840588 RepID=A0ACC0HA17_9ERIC|nr:SWI/SNF complex subunit SWI3C [Camellia lanceoleosa]
MLPTSSEHRRATKSEVELPLSLCSSVVASILQVQTTTAPNHRPHKSLHKPPPFSLALPHSTSFSFSNASFLLRPEKYMECCNWIVAKYMENPEMRLSVDDFRELVAGIDIDDLTRIVRFLDHWGIINYCAFAPNREHRSDGSYLKEDSNGEVHVPSAALKSIDSLIRFDKPKYRHKAADVYPSLSCHDGEESDLDSRIREQLSENRCNFCSCPLSIVYYQSQKEITKVPLDVIAFTAISLALVYIGSCNEEVAQAIIFALMDRSESELGEPLTRLLPLGLGLLYLGKQESVEATAEVSKTFNEKIRKYCDMTLLSCAYLWAECAQGVYSTPLI